MISKNTFLCLLGFVLWSCGSSDDSDEPTRLDTFNANVLNNIVQDPVDPSIDRYYPEFTLNLEEATLEDRNGVISVIAHWPDGRNTALEKDFRPQDGILRWVKHDLDRFGVLAPGGKYTFEVELNSGEILMPVEVFDQRLLGRPTNVNLERSGNDLVVSWTAPNSEHLWSAEILDSDPSSGQVLVSGPTGRQGSAREQVSFAFANITLAAGTYSLAIIISDQSNLRSLKIPFNW